MNDEETMGQAFGVALLCLAAAIAGCGGTVMLPSTPEAQSCSRECMFLANSCRASSGPGIGPAIGCANQQRSCLLTCPGAYVASEQASSGSNQRGGLR
jgi:hypothetical protein